MLSNKSHSLIPFTTRLGLFEDFSREMDNVFGQFFKGEGDGKSSLAARWLPRLNLSETDEAFELSFDLPGLNPDDVNVELREGALWITGKRQAESEDEGKKWHRVERMYGEFRRVVRLGDDVDPENIEAEYTDGVLHVSVSKLAKAQPKKIEIKR